MGLFAKYSHSPSCDAAVLARIAAAASPSHTSAWQLLFDTAHRHRHPIHDELANKLMRRGNNKSVQEKLSDSVSLESGSGMSAPRIGDRNARSHAPSAGAAQPALTRPWLTAFLASSPPPVCCLSVQTKSSRPHPDTFRPPPTRRLHRLASPSVSTASDHTRSCIMVSIQPNQRLHSNATTLTSDFPSTCHSSPNLLPLSCVLLHHRPLNNPRAFRPSSRPKRRPPRSSRRRALVCSHLALVQSPGPILTRASPLPFYRPHSEAQGRTQRGLQRD